MDVFPYFGRRELEQLEKFNALKASKPEDSCRNSRSHGIWSGSEEEAVF
jgi:hypothetical protein